MADKITFEPDLVSLAIADELITEQGVTLEEIAVDAFSAYMQRVRDARTLDLDEGARGSYAVSPTQHVCKLPMPRRAGSWNSR